MAQLVTAIVVKVMVWHLWLTFTSLWLHWLFCCCGDISAVSKICQQHTACTSHRHCKKNIVTHSMEPIANIKQQQAG
jgi:hypothetical protein